MFMYAHLPVTLRYHRAIVYKTNKKFAPIFKKKGNVFLAC